MGNEHSGLTEGKLYEEDEYVFVKQANDLRYGEIKILRHKASNYLVCEVNKVINSQMAFEKKKENSFFRKELNHSSLVKLINFTASKRDEFCGSFWKISLLYEYLDHDLKREIEHRKKNTVRFTEGQLWYILTACTGALLYLRNKKITHGDIRPYSILISTEGFVKLAENFQFNKPLTAYMQLLTGLRDEPYVSPAFFKALKDKNPDPQLDFSKNDVFALGLSLLEAATLESSIQCYDSENFEFKQLALQTLLETANTHYSQAFNRLLQIMLHEDEELRPSLESILFELEEIQKQSWWSSEVPDRIIQLPQEQEEALVQPEQQTEQVTPNSNQQQLQQPLNQQRPEDSTLGTVGRDIYIPQGYQDIIRRSDQAVGSGITGQYLENRAYNPDTYSANQDSLKYTGGYVPQYTFDQQTYTSSYTSPQTQQVPYSSLSMPKDTSASQNYQKPLEYRTNYENLEDLDARINAVLQMSRDTVIKYGGQKAIESYERFGTSSNISLTQSQLPPQQLQQQPTQQQVQQPQQQQNLYQNDYYQNRESEKQVPASSNNQYGLRETGTQDYTGYTTQIGTGVQGNQNQQYYFTGGLDPAYYNRIVQDKGYQVQDYQREPNIPASSSTAYQFTGQEEQGYRIDYKPNVDTQYYTNYQATYKANQPIQEPKIYDNTSSNTTTLQQTTESRQFSNEKLPKSPGITQQEEYQLRSGEKNTSVSIGEQRELSRQHTPTISGSKDEKTISDNELDDQIKKSLKRSKEVEDMIKSTRKVLEQDNQYNQ